ncbi:cytokinin dehydrogenase 3-like [Punica granatum]|uniref:cytokinin dehydrogenase n=2 Tax=Punica granatum TaxID=22663 RepID=A0A6P8CFR8_PUNGR|nr:cytokinin dehydrogenase 3-like [Punica granatum]
MEERHPNSTYFITIFIISGLLSTVGESSKPYANSTEFPAPLPNDLSSLPNLFANELRLDPDSINLASTDYGNIFRVFPAAVLHPTSLNNVVSLIQSSYNSSTPFTIAARGQGHSVQGQAMSQGGVVVNMMSLREHAINNSNNDQSRAFIASVFHRPSGKYLHYADVGGEMLWIDVLQDTTKQGFSPVSWTDYLYLSVGGTLSNAGISGQTFRFGPQISNVHELDVITGTGEFLTCSRSKNSELFYAVLGGLGQFGIITRARIALEPAPKRVKWVRMLYNDFSVFTRDQERLISIHGRKQRNALDYVEGFLMMNQQGSPDSWFPSSEHARITSLVTKYGVIYCLEVAKYYDDLSRDSVDMDLENLFRGLGHTPGFRYKKDVSYVEFLNRVRVGELQLRSQGLWDVPHPWLNLFLPKSHISDFNEGVFRNIILKNNITTGLVLFYPMNRNKWDDRMSASILDEEVFYTVAFLQSTGFDDWQHFDQQNNQVLQYCKDAGIRIKQYLPHYRSKEDWAGHFGSKWRTFRERKTQFDPKMILSPGQMIFN